VFASVCAQLSPLVISLSSRTSPPCSIPLLPNQRRNLDCVSQGPSPFSRLQRCCHESCRSSVPPPVGGTAMSSGSLRDHCSGSTDTIRGSTTHCTVGSFSPPRGRRPHQGASQQATKTQYSTKETTTTDTHPVGRDNDERNARNVVGTLDFSVPAVFFPTSPANVTPHPPQSNNDKMEASRCPHVAH
jgi:hypothetical protein